MDKTPRHAPMNNSEEDEKEIVYNILSTIMPYITLTNILMVFNAKIGTGNRGYEKIMERQY